MGNKTAGSDRAFTSLIWAKFLTSKILEESLWIYSEKFLFTFKNSDKAVLETTYGISDEKCIQLCATTWLHRLPQLCSAVHIFQIYITDIVQNP